MIQLGVLMTRPIFTVRFCQALSMVFTAHLLTDFDLIMQRAKKLPPNWRYESATASALVA